MPLNIMMGKKPAAKAVAPKTAATKPILAKKKIVQPPDEDEDETELDTTPPDDDDAEEAVVDADDEDEAPPPKKKPLGAGKGAAAKPVAKKVSVLNQGDAAVKAQVQEEAIQEQMRADRGKSIPFRIKEGDEHTITFLDGVINSDGYLGAPNYYCHTVKNGGRWRDFACTANIDTSQPCPICEAGDNRASLVSMLTVIDHTPYEIQNGAKAGEVVPYTKKLFACKNKTVKLLTKIAVKRGGTLEGCTFDVSRTGEKEPAVGNQFDFTQKWEDWNDFAAANEIDPEDLTLIDYQDEVVYHTPEELVELGLGKAFKGIGTLKKKPLKGGGAKLASKL